VLGDAAHEGEAALEAPGVEVVEEEPADAAGLVAVLEVEVVVAPALEPGVQGVGVLAVVAEALAGGAGGAVPVDHVLIEAVVGREVEAAAEPPDRRLAGLLGDEEAHVHVRGGHIGVARVHDQRHAHGAEAAPGQLRPARAGRRRQLVAAHVGEVDAALLEHGAVLQDARAPAAAAGALPGVLAEAGAAVLPGEGAADAVLQVEQVVAHGAAVGLVRSVFCLAGLGVPVNRPLPRCMVADPAAPLCAESRVCAMGVRPRVAAFVTRPRLR
jgi:hypothetical protein